MDSPGTSTQLCVLFCCHLYEANCFFTLHCSEFVFLLLLQVSVSLLLLVIWYLPAVVKFSERWVLGRLHFRLSASGTPSGGKPPEALNIVTSSGIHFGSKEGPCFPASHPRNQHCRLIRIYLALQLPSLQQDSSDGVGFHQKIALFWFFKTALSNRNTRAPYLILDFLVATLKKSKKEQVTLI